MALPRRWIAPCLATNGAPMGKWDISILTESEMEQEGKATLEESPDRIGRFDDDLELGGAGLTGAGDVEEPETRKG